MDVNPALVEAMFTGYDTRFQQGYDRDPVNLWVNEIASEVTSAGQSEIHAWINEIPRLEPWIGDVPFTALTTNAYQLTNGDWARGIKIPRNTIADDLFGIYSDYANQLGIQARLWPQEMAWRVIANAHATLCYDGQNFCDTAHPINPYKLELGTQSNYFTSTPLTIDNFWTVRQKMRLFKTAENRPLGVIPSILLVPPQLEEQADIVINSQQIAPQTLASGTQVGGQSNPAYHKAKIVVAPELGDTVNSPLGSAAATTWYLIDNTRPIRPFFNQIREAPSIVARVSATDPNVFNGREYQWKCEARGAAGVTLWQLAAMCLA